MNYLSLFWLALTIACVVWYCTVTVYISIRGVFDIRGMLQRLAAAHEGEPPAE